MEIFSIIGIVLFLAIFIIAYFFNDETRTKRKLKKSPNKMISSFQENEIGKIIGTSSIIHTPLIAPLSDRSCLAYHIIVEQKRNSKNGNSWRTIIDEKIFSDFVINTNQNFAIVKAQNVKSLLVKDKNYTSGFLNDATPKLKEFLREYGHDSENFFGLNKSLRYREGILEEGELISVLGTGNWKENTYTTDISSRNEVLEISSSADQALYLSDHPETVISS